MESLFELYLKLTGYDIEASTKIIKSIQSLNFDEFIAWQNKNKWDIAKFHYKNNEFYRLKVGKYFPSKWEDLPIMKKTDYQYPLLKMLSRHHNKNNVYVANTSGSSGNPFFFAKNKNAHAMDWAIIKNRYSWHNININSKQARFYGIGLKNDTYLREIVKDKIMNRVRFSVFDLSDKKLEEFLSRLSKTKFKIIYGYTNSLLIFAKYLDNNNYNLSEICPSLEYCITTSEVLRDQDKTTIEKVFSISVLNEYGASEVGIIAFDNEYKKWELSEEILYYEIINQNKNVSGINEGNIILTDLDNLAMPFIRYDIGDIGIISSARSKLNNRILKKLLGRENDNIILPSGKISPGLTFYYISRAILESENGVVKEFIVRQIKPDLFYYDIVSNSKLDKKIISQIQIEMDKYLEPGLKFKIFYVEFISRPKTGKIKHFYSELKN